MIEASCLCGRIIFTIHGELSSARTCHCTTCRKFSGTSPAAWAMARAADLRIDPEADLEAAVTRYDSGRGIRCFCARCGSPVWFESKDYSDIVMIPLGVLDDGDVPTPSAHIFVGSKPGWCSIHDDLPQHATYPEA